MKKKVEKKEMEIMRALAKKMLPPERTERITESDFLKWVEEDSVEDNYSILFKECINGEIVPVSLQFVKTFFGEGSVNKRFSGDVLHKPSNITFTIMWIAGEQRYSVLRTINKPEIDHNWPEYKRYDLLIGKRSST